MGHATFCIDGNGGGLRIQRCTFLCIAHGVSRVVVGGDGGDGDDGGDGGDGGDGSDSDADSDADRVADRVVGRVVGRVVRRVVGRCWYDFGGGWRGGGRKRNFRHFLCICFVI